MWHLKGVRQQIQLGSWDRVEGSIRSEADFFLIQRNDLNGHSVVVGQTEREVGVLGPLERQGDQNQNNPDQSQRRQQIWKLLEGRFALEMTKDGQEDRNNTWIPIPIWC